MKYVYIVEREDLGAIAAWSTYDKARTDALSEAKADGFFRGRRVREEDVRGAEPTYWQVQTRAPNGSYHATGIAIYKLEVDA